MIKINGKSYKEIIVMDRKNNVIAIINDKGKIVENNGAKVLLVANKNWQKQLHWIMFCVKMPIWVIGAGCVGLHSFRMEVMPMKNHFDFKDLMTFGLFLLALLTFIFTFCK